MACHVSCVTITIPTLGNRDSATPPRDSLDGGNEQTRPFSSLLKENFQLVERVGIDLLVEYAYWEITRSVYKVVDVRHDLCASHL